MKIVLYYIIFILLHVTLVITTSMFFITWGAKRTLLEEVYVVFISKPFDASTNLWLLLLNAFCWATVFYILYRAFHFLRKSAV